MRLLTSIDKPLILVPPRRETKYDFAAGKGPQAYNQTMVSSFADALLYAGGIPLMPPLTTDVQVLDDLLEICDGVCLQGGHDVDPKLWGDFSDYDQDLLAPERDRFELDVLQRAIQADIPIFTTCRGTQLLNVCCGGSLCMDVDGRLKEQSEQMGVSPCTHIRNLEEYAHEVEIYPNTLVWECVGHTTHLLVNSYHHCCVDKLGSGLKVAGCASDGTIEALELSGHRFCVGVQWHPEYTYLKNPPDAHLWRAFIDACRCS